MFRDISEQHGLCTSSSPYLQSRSGGTSSEQDVAHHARGHRVRTLYHEILLQQQSLAVVE